MTDQAEMADSGERGADAARSAAEHRPNVPAVEETARNLEAILRAYNGSLDQRTELDQVIGRMYEDAVCRSGSITRSLPKGNAPGS